VQVRNPPRLILCVDQAAKSGWCIVRPLTTAGAVAEVVSPDYRNIVEHGTATTFGARRSAMVQFAQHVLRRGLRPSDVWLVLEDHAKNSWGKASAATMVGTGKARGWWEEQWLFHDMTHAHVHAVAPKTWRGAVLNTNKGGDVARDLAQREVRRVLGFDVCEDEAEAVCIGLWAAANLERVLRGEPAPKKPRKKRRKAAA
jgi:hypothetical protein